MITRNYRLKLARLLKLYTERNTEQGLLVAETEDDLAVGVEVFTPDENGEMIPAKDGEYMDNTNNVKIVVEGGTIKSIEEIPAEGTIENPETNGQPEDVVSVETTTTTEMEDPSETPEVAVEVEQPAEENKDERIADLEIENAELKTKIAELEAELAEYKAKEEEVAPTAEEVEKFGSQEPITKEDKMIAKTLKAAKRMASIK